MLFRVDDRRLGLAIRAIRRRRGWRQIDVSVAAHTSQAMVSLVERGRIEEASLRTLRAICGAVDARLSLDLSWRGAAIDRLLDERHSALVDAIVAMLGVEWEVLPEFTFAHFGERGSIDVLAWHASTETLLVIEVKTELASIEETLRRMDVKVRLVPTMVQERGWRPRVVARLLVIADSGAARRAVAGRAATFDTVLPERGWNVRRWLRKPAGPMSGILFLPVSSHASGRRTGGGSHRVRRPSQCQSRAPQRSDRCRAAVASASRIVVRLTTTIRSMSGGTRGLTSR